jgi:hypothetical protein
MIASALIRHGLLSVLLLATAIVATSCRSSEGNQDGLGSFILKTVEMGAAIENYRAAKGEPPKTMKDLEQFCRDRGHPFDASRIRSFTTTERLDGKLLVRYALVGNERVAFLLSSPNEEPSIQFVPFDEVR